MAIKVVNQFTEDLDKVAGQIRKLDGEYLIVNHSFKAGEAVSGHVHESNEWVILPPKARPNDQCEITIGDESEIITLGPMVKVICIPAKKEHSFRAITAIPYIVLRDGFN
jgi:hypothetical protein